MSLVDYIIEKWLISNIKKGIICRGTHYKNS